MENIYFEFNLKEMSVPQAINQSFRKAGRWYDITSIEIKPIETGDTGLEYYCKCDIKKKGVSTIESGHFKKECRPVFD